MSVKSEPRQEFVELGISMKNYVIAAVSTVLVSVVGAAIIAYLVLTPAIGFRIGGIAIGATFIVISLLVTFGFYVSYVSRLGKVARTSQHLDLTAAHNYYLAGIIVGVIGVLVIIFVPLGSMMNFMSIPTPTPAMIADIAVPIIVAAILVGLVPAILNILGAFRLNAWANWYAFSHGTSYSARRIYDGSNVMKWGSIVTLIPMVSIAGGIMSFVGFYLTGSGLVSEFERETVISEPKRQEVISPPIQPVTSATAEGPKSIPTIPPNSTVSPLIRFCGKCGTKIEVDNARFCVACGSSL